MKNIKFLIFFVAALLTSFNASADYTCNVTVQNVLVYSNGGVNVLHSGRGDYTVICSLNGDYQGVSGATCAMWTATLLAIKKKAGTAAFWFAGNGTCATLPTYSSAPAPIYIGDVTP